MAGGVAGSPGPPAAPPASAEARPGSVSATTLWPRGVVRRAKVIIPQLIIGCISSLISELAWKGHGEPELQLRALLP
jgi:hypothetical protein